MVKRGAISWVGGVCYVSEVVEGLSWQCDSIWLGELR
jgi:hypothetical protein